MAEFRTIKCSMWREDDWFLDLPTDGKLLWVYLFSNPSASVAGIYRLSLRTMANETGLTHERIGELLTLFANANKAHFADGVVWVVKMREHQSSKSPKVQGRINTDIASLPSDNSVYRMYARRYGIDTVSIPIRTDTDTDTDTETETDTKHAAARKPNGKGVDDDVVSKIQTAHVAYVGPKLSADQARGYRDMLQVTTVAAIVDALKLAHSKQAREPYQYAMQVLRNKAEEGKLPSDRPHTADFDAPSDIAAALLEIA